MPEISENTEVNETPENNSEMEGIDSDFEAELDGKCEEYTSGERTLEDIQRDKEELMQMREELMRYKESQEFDSSESDGEDDPETVLALRRHR